MKSLSPALTLLTLAMSASTVLAIGDRPGNDAPAPDRAAALGAAWASVIAARLDWSVRPSDVLTVEITNCEPMEPEEPATAAPLSRDPESTIPPAKRETP